jgi:hypothetical protein
MGAAMTSTINSLRASGCLAQDVEIILPHLGPGLLDHLKGDFKPLQQENHPIEICMDLVREYRNQLQRNTSRRGTRSGTLASEWDIPYQHWFRFTPRDNGESIIEYTQKHPHGMKDRRAFPLDDDEEADLDAIPLASARSPEVSKSSKVR